MVATQSKNRGMAVLQKPQTRQQASLEEQAPHQRWLSSVQPAHRKSNQIWGLACPTGPARRHSQDSRPPRASQVVAHTTLKRATHGHVASRQLGTLLGYRALKPRQCRVASTPPVMKHSKRQVATNAHTAAPWWGRSGARVRDQQPHNKQESRKCWWNVSKIWLKITPAGDIQRASPRKSY